MSKVPRGSDAPAAKLSEAEVVDIKRRLESGEHFRSVADDYPVSDRTIHHIKAGRTWRHVDV